MTVRCAPLVPVARTDGVMEIVRLVARQFRDAGGTVLRTNLDLDAPIDDFGTTETPSPEDAE